MLGLEGIICNDYIQLDSEAYGVYELEILETQHGTELFYIDITNTSKTVTKSSSKNRSCDVSVSLTSSDLAGILTGKDEFRFIIFLPVILFLKSLELANAWLKHQQLIFNISVFQNCIAYRFYNIQGSDCDTPFTICLS